MKFYRVALLTLGAGVIFSACGDDSSSSSTSFSCNIKESSNSAELQMSSKWETYTHSGELRDGKIFNEYKYVLSSKEDADELCRDLKNEPGHDDIKCSDKTVSFTYTTNEPKAKVDRIVQELEEECEGLKSLYADEDEDLDDDDDDEEDDDDYGYDGDNDE